MKIAIALLSLCVSVMGAEKVEENPVVKKIQFKANKDSPEGIEFTETFERYNKFLKCFGEDLVNLGLLDGLESEKSTKEYNEISERLNKSRIELCELEKNHNKSYVKVMKGEPPFRSAMVLSRLTKLCLDLKGIKGREKYLISKCNHFSELASKAYYEFNRARNIWSINPEIRDFEIKCKTAHIEHENLDARVSKIKHKIRGVQSEINEHEEEISELGKILPDMKKKESDLFDSLYIDMFYVSVGTQTEPSEQEASTKLASLSLEDLL